MILLKIAFVLLLCLPLAYLAVHFLGDAWNQLAFYIKRKKRIKERNNEKRSVYYNGRPGRRR
ncbi:MAG TPA: hypothetical protein PLM92_04395 [Bacillota bacterium]|jgi:hypothetical protein|nr:hypothetical protein [Clostridiales bacterium]HPR24407.1 hypothetical protein [Bacillota bacterium]HUM56502.1 hypothetical protein [Bacillota bacterium]